MKTCVSFLGLVYVLGTCFYIISAGVLSGLTVTTYYSSADKESIYFVKNHLYPTYEKMGTFFTTIMVPFGKCKTITESRRLDFDCPNGSDEIFANKVHGCVLVKTPEKTAINYIYCSMSNKKIPQLGDLQSCASKHGINWKTTIKYCIDSGYGDELLAKHGQITSQVYPNITNFPAIAINGRYDPSISNNLAKDFMNEICEQLNNIPTNCLKGGRFLKRP